MSEQRLNRFCHVYALIDKRTPYSIRHTIQGGPVRIAGKTSFVCIVEQTRGDLYVKTRYASMNSRGPWMEIDRTTKGIPCEIIKK